MENRKLRLVWDDRTSLHTPEEFTTAECVKTKFRLLYSEIAQCPTCFFLFCNGHLITPGASIEEVMKMTEAPEVEITALSCKNFHLNSGKQIKISPKKINMENAAEKAQERTASQAESAEAETGDTEAPKPEVAKNPLPSIIRVRNSEGRVLNVKRSQIIEVRGKYYLLRKKKELKMDIREVLPRYSEMLTYCLMGVLLSFYLSRMFLVVSVLLFFMSYLDKIKITVRFKKGETLKNLLKHAFCFFATFFMNPGQNLIICTGNA